MKKIYEKPMVVRREKLGKVTAMINGSFDLET